jgi:hypothetical protein
MERHSGALGELDPLFLLRVDVADEGEAETPRTDMGREIGGCRVPLVQHRLGGRQPVSIGSGIRAGHRQTVKMSMELSAIGGGFGVASGRSVALSRFVARGFVENDLETGQGCERGRVEGTQGFERCRAQIVDEEMVCRVE